jgi:hypothetical protein
MLSKIAFLAVFVGLVCCADVHAQFAPPGAGDKNLENRDIKDRSIELERVKRDAEKPDRKDQKAAPTPPAVNFQQVKEDFETIQKLQDDIVSAYSKSKEINYKQISADSAQMNQSALRLESNLFPPVEKKKDNKKASQEVTAPVSEPILPKDVKSLIVEQDSALGSFVSSPMFTNPQVVNPDSSAKAHADLQRLIKLSAALQVEADKLKK